jgi:glycosyltransferase involved in cell wall biosynthesis
MISAIILTHNNEGSLRKTLDSVSWCDAKIVIDDKSSDKTLDIANSMGATVYSHPLGDNFAAQRNFGLTKVASGWVLFIDSDEEVSIELRNEIQRAITNENINGYYLRRKDFFINRWLTHGETAHVTLLRLGQVGIGRWTRAVHEVWGVKGRIGTLRHPLLHRPHATLREFLSDINIYSTLNAKAFYDQGVRASVLQIIFYPKAKFIKNYFILGGFLDGTAGAVMAIMMSLHSFLTRAKLWHMHSKRSLV